MVQIMTDSSLKALTSCLDTCCWVSNLSSHYDILVHMFLRIILRNYLLAKIKIYILKQVVCHSQVIFFCIICTTIYHEIYINVE